MGKKDEMRQGAIILCGGRSSRMGRDKATLPFGPESMLQRVARLVSDIVPRRNIVVVAAPGQELPVLPPEIQIARDERQDRGPLEGLAAGLRVLNDSVDAAYATSCDVPLLVPGFIAAMFEFLGEHDIAVPRDGEHHHPLAAIYRTSVLKNVQRLLDADRLRPRFLFDDVKTREVTMDELRSVDPKLSTLENLNRPDDYRAALSAAGFPPPLDSTPT
jgi:molybdopterin-guanine dinucleotide biosynthesis protein A